MNPLPRSASRSPLATTVGIAARIIHIDARNAIAGAHNFRQQTRAPTRPTSVSTENRSCFVFVTLQAVIELTSRWRAVIGVGDFAETGLSACLAIVDSIVIPDLRAF